MGFSDRQLSTLTGSNELAIRRLRQEMGITPFVKQIDTVAAEFPAFTNYLYTTYSAVENDINFEDHGVMVLGSGVYRIGSSVEFDWCAVRAIRTLRERGFKTVMVNYNPETVSTDYDEADRLYFENISLENILDIYEIEASSGVIISMGGQTPNNIALPLHRQGVKILGTSPEMIDTAENRYKFSRMLDQIGVDQPLWKELSTLTEAHAFCNKVEYPVLVRPSYVLSGAAMNVVYSADDLDSYLTQAANVSRDHPVVISKFIEEAKEIEMDAVAKDGKLVMHYICEHVENAGVHSGDATLIHPPQDLDPVTIKRIEEATQKIGYALNVTGPFNIQFMAKNNEIKVIECNLRAARSWPFVSKVTGIDAIELATDVMIGQPVTPYPESQMPQDYVGIKVPQFSFSRLSGADPISGVEMASTGEVACFGKDKYEAYLKSLLSTGIKLPKQNILFSIGSYKEKLEMLPSVQKLHRAGFNIFATAGTADFIQEHGIPVKYLEALVDEDGKGDSQKSEYSLDQHLANNLIDFYVNLPSKNRYRRPATYMSKGYRSRRMAVDFAVPLLTNVKCAKLFIEALVRKPSFQISNVDFKSSHRTVNLPGFINISTFIPGVAKAHSSDTALATQAALHGGFTTLLISPIGDGNRVEDAASLELASANAHGLSSCDYAFSVTARDTTNVSDDIATSVRALYLAYNDKSVSAPTVGGLAPLFSSWPEDKPIITDAKKNDLASILLLASLHSRSIHVTGVSSAVDMELIALSKQKDLAVTCDVSIYALFLSTSDFPEAKCLPTKPEQDALWENLEQIDAFSVGTLPYELASELGQSYSPEAGFEEALLLCLTAVKEGRLSLDTLTAKMSTNPAFIFGLSPSTDTYIEVEVDRPSQIAKHSYWSPLASSKKLCGAIDRVVIRGQVAYLESQTSVKAKAVGEDVSEVSAAITTQGRRKSARFSFTGQRPALAAITGGAGHQVSQSQLMSQDSLRSPKLAQAALPVSSPAQRGLGEAQPIQSFTSGGFAAGAPFSFAPTVRIPHEPAFHRRHILSVKQFNREQLHALFNLASELRTQVERGVPIEVLRGRVLCTLFFESSTRTSASFEAAMNRLGGKVVSVPVDRSSVLKGESLADTIRTLGCYGDAVVMRHPDVGAAQVAAKFSPVPIINAGDGAGEHPTQALLDVFCIREGNFSVCSLSTYQH